jgi:hypothetical protein
MILIIVKSKVMKENFWKFPIDGVVYVKYQNLLKNQKTQTENWHSPNKKVFKNCKRRKTFNFKTLTIKNSKTERKKKHIKNWNKNLKNLWEWIKFRITWIIYNFVRCKKFSYFILNIKISFIWTKEWKGIN